jgi:hypothetical protein
MLKTHKNQITQLRRCMMKGTFKQQSLLLIIACCLPLVLAPAGCNLNTGMKSNTIECSECGDSAAKKIGVKPLNYYTPKGTELPIDGGPPNCHAFAWQVNCGVPNVNDIPGYYLASPTPFWLDGSYTLIAEGYTWDPIPANVQVGDKAVYGNEAHSAVVYSVDKYDPKFISYTIGKPSARIHHPTDPGGSFGSWVYYYHVSRSDYCRITATPSPVPVTKMRFLDNGLLHVSVGENTKNSTIGWIYYARMLNSDDLYRYIWVLTFDTGDGWWERRETRQQTSQDAGIIFHQFILKGATKMEVYIYSQDIYGRNTRMVHETRYKSEMGY